MVNQRDSSVRKKHLTIMILPHNSMKEIMRINLPHWLAKCLAGIGIAIVLLVIIFFSYSAIIVGRLVHYYALQAENKYQEQQIKAFFEKTTDLENGIRELEERDQELREMLGLQKAEKKTIKINAITTPEEGLQRLATLQQKIVSKKEHYAFLKEASVALVSKFNAYPSFSPANGVVYQKMGWRIHPIKGVPEFHEGIDIPVWVGCPVRAAANGVVVFSGWARGYGYLVMVDHGNGYKTLYGHNERLMVGRGERVYKGQVVAKAGSTGLSTGPHVHYQVEYNNKIVNPEHFLDLNIRSARYF